MPVHDWTRVDAGTFHAFHNAWITHLMEGLNDGVLPAEYYALSEQIASRRQTDVLTLQVQPQPTSGLAGGLAVSEVAPAVRHRLKPSQEKHRRPIGRRNRRLIIRHITGHRVVAVIEIVSPANKDRQSSLRELAEKVVQLLQADIHVLVIDLLPPGRFDPQGVHAVIWSAFDTVGYTPPATEPYTLASYRWEGSEPEVFLEPVGLGKALIDMPLFLQRDRYVNVPLERTYLEAYRRFPGHWRQVLEAEESQG